LAEPIPYGKQCQISAMLSFIAQSVNRNISKIENLFTLLLSSAKIANKAGFQEINLPQLYGRSIHPVQ
jgi:aspartate ammonia-lyase